MMMSFAAEPLLTGLGAGGYMLVCSPEGSDVLLDFFVEAPGRDREHRGHAPLLGVDVSFGDATQQFHVGAASVGTYGMPAGLCAARRRSGPAGAGRPGPLGGGGGGSGGRPAATAASR